MEKEKKKNTHTHTQAECLLERANDLIVDCVSMSECSAKLPTRVEASRGRSGKKKLRRGFQGRGGRKKRNNNTLDF